MLLSFCACAGHAWQVHCRKPITIHNNIPCGKCVWPQAIHFPFSPSVQCMASRNEGRQCESPPLLLTKVDQTMAILEYEFGMSWRVCHIVCEDRKRIMSIMCMPRLLHNAKPCQCVTSGVQQSDWVALYNSDFLCPDPFPLCEESLGIDYIESHAVFIAFPK